MNNYLIVIANADMKYTCLVKFKANDVSELLDKYILLAGENDYIMEVIDCGKEEAKVLEPKIEDNWTVYLNRYKENKNA